MQGLTALCFVGLFEWNPTVMLLAVALYRCIVSASCAAYIPLWAYVAAHRIASSLCCLQLADTPNRMCQITTSLSQ
jgi:hypothetical protein